MVLNMNRGRALEIAQGLLAQPTVPLVEARPSQWIQHFAAEHGLEKSIDRAGNVLVSYRGTPDSTKGLPVVLVAHMDHPGFVVENDRVSAAGNLVSLTFRGGLLAANAIAGASLAFFNPHSSDQVASGVIVEAHGDEQGRLVGARVELTEGAIGSGAFAMWDFPDAAPNGVVIDDTCIKARACDDLLGAAAILTTLTTLAETCPQDVVVHGLFTRAEEVGFYGALEAIRLQTIEPHALVLSLECSKALGHAPQGDGVIVRVGDRLTIFDPQVTDALLKACERSSNNSETSVRYQRKLMDGGACEASVFCATGHRASGLAVALGNYHNADDDQLGIAPEHVLIADYLAEVELLERLTADADFVDSSLGASDPSWLDERIAAARSALGAEPSKAEYA